MTKEQLAEEIRKLLAANPISVNDAMQVLTAHAVTIAIVSYIQSGRGPEAARAKLHEYVDLAFDQGLLAVIEAGKP